jgi:hypothetical protein
VSSPSQSKTQSPFTRFLLVSLPFVGEHRPSRATTLPIRAAPHQNAPHSSCAATPQSLTSEGFSAAQRNRLCQAHRTRTASAASLVAESTTARAVKRSTISYGPLFSFRPAKSGFAPRAPACCVTPRRSPTLGVASLPFFPLSSSNASAALFVSCFARASLFAAYVVRAWWQYSKGARTMRSSGGVDVQQ